MVHPSFKFTTHPSISSYAVPCKTFLATSAKDLPFNYIATGALVFESSESLRILLIQRAAHDSMGSLWEIPGGACDTEDANILHGVARELWEETGLVASSIGPKVGEDNIFSTRSGKVVCKFNFLVEAEKHEDGHFHLKLDSNEHQAFVWAREEEVQAHKVGDVELKFTTSEQEHVVLEAFKEKRKSNMKGTS
jgi:8-oxo-dGTP pyrophosphatase MutT (NUDIX family)